MYIHVLSKDDGNAPDELRQRWHVRQAVVDAKAGAEAAHIGRRGRADRRRRGLVQLVLVDARAIQGDDRWCLCGGEITTIASKVAGLVETVAITDNQTIKAGVVKLDDRVHDLRT
jgi:hypothetical protein